MNRTQEADFVLEILELIDCSGGFRTEKLYLRFQVLYSSLGFLGGAGVGQWSVAARAG